MAPHPGSIVRLGFTAIELTMVLAVALAVVGAGSSAMLPSLRKAALNESLATLEEACRSARQLATAERDAGAGYFGVVLYREGGHTWVAVTQGPSATPGTILLDAAGEPRFRARLADSVVAFVGDSQASAAFLDEGQDLGWLYHHRSGYLSASSTLNITPTFLGVPAAELGAEGVVGAVSLAGALSLRTLDGSNGRAVAIYASGILAVSEL